MTCYVVVLPDGTEVRFQADKPPTPEVIDMLSEVIEAAAQMTPADFRAIEDARKIHYAIQPFHPICRADLPNQRTTTDPDRTTCPACLELMR